MYYPLIVIHEKGADIAELLDKYDEEKHREFIDMTEETRETYVEKNIEKDKGVTFDIYASEWCGLTKKIVDGVEKWGNIYNPNAKFDAYNYEGRFDGILVNKEGYRTNNMPAEDLNPDTIREWKELIATQITEEAIEELRQRYPIFKENTRERVTKLMGIVFTHIYDASADKWTAIDNVSFDEGDYETVLYKKEDSFKKWSEALRALRKPNYEATLLTVHI